MEASLLQVMTFIHLHKLNEDAEASLYIIRGVLTLYSIVQTSHINSSIPGTMTQIPSLFRVADLTK
jgi:hypothetical protein